MALSADSALSTDRLDVWGNGYVHALCLNPKLSADALHRVTAVLRAQCGAVKIHRDVLRRNALDLLPIQYIEANGCFPTQSVQRMEAMMESARSVDTAVGDNDDGKRYRRLLAMRWYFEWRAMKRPFSAEEAVLDLVEALDVVMNGRGQIEWFQVRCSLICIF